MVIENFWEGFIRGLMLEMIVEDREAGKVCVLKVYFMGRGGVMSFE